MTMLLGHPHLRYPVSDERKVIGMVGRWLSAEDAMSICNGMTRWTFNRMCRDGLWRCRKIGRFWYVHQSEFE